MVGFLGIIHEMDSTKGKWALECGTFSWGHFRGSNTCGASVSSSSMSALTSCASSALAASLSITYTPQAIHQQASQEGPESRFRSPKHSGLRRQKVSAPDARIWESSSKAYGSLGSTFHQGIGHAPQSTQLIFGLEYCQLYRERASALQTLCARVQRARQGTIFTAVGFAHVVQ